MLLFGSATGGNGIFEGVLGALEGSGESEDDGEERERAGTGAEKQRGDDV